MDDYKDAIAACCKQLRLSVNLVENAMIQTGGSHQEWPDVVKCQFPLQS